MPQRVRARWRRAPIEACGDGGAKRGGEQSVGAPSPTPTAHCAEGWIVAGSAMRYRGADAGWNDRVRSFGPPSATAPRTWSMVTAWMRRTGVMMHRCHAPAFLRRRELSALCVFGTEGLKMAHKTFFFTSLSWSHTTASAFRPSRAAIYHGIWG